MQQRHLQQVCFQHGCRHLMPASLPTSTTTLSLSGSMQHKNGHITENKDENEDVAEPRRHYTRWCHETKPRLAWQAPAATHLHPHMLLRVYVRQPLLSASRSLLLWLRLLAVHCTPVHLVAVCWQETVDCVPEVAEALGCLHVGVGANGRHDR